jgi:GDP-mannose 6-dehydrogenase
MNISVFGLGYVGCVNLGCLAQNGHKIIGVDINQSKVNLINCGKPTIIEKDIDHIIKSHHENGRIRATTDFIDALKNTEVSFICVGTPSLETGQLNHEFVYNTAQQIAEGLKESEYFHVVAIRSTVFPGTNERVTEIIENVSEKKRNRDFAVVSNPEFLREGSAVEDYYNPAVTVVGLDNERAMEILREIYKPINAPFIATDIKAAEMIKYVNNAFHALKIAFANEIGNICKSIKVDSYKVMELFKMDTRLNISTAYFNPGMAYGGSCLPKDLRGLSTIAHDNYVNSPVIDAVEHSNLLQKKQVLDIVKKYNKKKIGLLGLAFKKGTDDLRYSPSVDIAEGLLGKGYNLMIYDKYVSLSFLTGTNKNYIEQHLPHLSQMLEDDFKDVIQKSEMIIIAHKPDLDEIQLLRGFRGIIVDLVRLTKDSFQATIIEGISW